MRMRPPQGLSRAERVAWCLAQTKPDERGCREYPGAHNGRGYCQIYFAGRIVVLPRLVLEDKLGRPLSADEQTRHTCDNRRCINPDHLLPGSRSDNMQDMISRGRQRSGTRRLTAAQVHNIRRWHCPGKSKRQRGNTAALAEQFGVHPHTISMLTREARQAVV